MSVCSFLVDTKQKWKFPRNIFVIDIPPPKKKIQAGIIEFMLPDGQEFFSYK